MPDEIAITVFQKLRVTGMNGDFANAQEELRERAWLLGRSLAVTSGSREIAGTAIDVGAEGELILETESGSRETVVSADRVRW